jgi:UDP-N-acetylmuramoylalanine--D-glutamate ligase
MTGNMPLPARVAILGFARSGQALARALADRGVAIAVGDARPRSAFSENDVLELEEAGARFFFDGPSEDFLERADWLALSPGVPMASPLVLAARARSIAVLAEIEIAWRIAEGEAEGKNRWIAVTGTNGKSTTTAWIAEILRRAGRPVALAGNIGVPLSAFLSDRTPRDFVCEVSSFQLEAIECFAAHVAVLTNITPDHLDRHDGFGDYVRAKERVFENQLPRDFAVINADDLASRPIVTRARRVAFSRVESVPGGAWVEGGSLVSEVAGERRAVVPLSDLALPGAHNVENALAALATADCLGTPAGAVAAGLRNFHGLPHRTELVAGAAGVAWVDDSKGTNVDATKKSLEGFPAGSVILILGGRDKHGDFRRRPWRPVAPRGSATIGEAAGLTEAPWAGVAPPSAPAPWTGLSGAPRSRGPATVLLPPACAPSTSTRTTKSGRPLATPAREVAGRGSGLDSNDERLPRPESRVPRPEGAPWLVSSRRTRCCSWRSSRCRSLGA